MIVFVGTLLFVFADLVYRCSTRAEKDLRIQDGTVACARYLQYIQTLRPQTPTVADVLTEIEEKTGMPMEFENHVSMDEFMSTVFPKFYESYHKAYDIVAQKCDAVTKKCDAVTKERDAFARAFRKQLLNHLRTKRGITPSDEIYQKIVSIDDPDTLDLIQSACWNEDYDADEIRREIEQIIANASNDYLTRS